VVGSSLFEDVVVRAWRPRMSGITLNEGNLISFFDSSFCS
jgi:hypothetical protein